MSATLKARTPSLSVRYAVGGGVGRCHGEESEYDPKRRALFEQGPFKVNGRVGVSIMEIAIASASSSSSASMAALALSAAAPVAGTESMKKG